METSKPKMYIEHWLLEKDSAHKALHHLAKSVYLMKIPIVDTFTLMATYVAI